ncbi:hypothetical protein [Rhizobium etli]|uniref:hypothetical protein n=1 Tax=Rhizobium etli TaxID=29449 RepID=UPI00163E9A40|nr:hypothetical protein [Rhizobium sp. IE4771]
MDGRLSCYFQKQFARTGQQVIDLYQRSLEVFPLCWFGRRQGAFQAFKGKDQEGSPHAARPLEYEAELLNLKK